MGTNKKIFLNFIKFILLFFFFTEIIFQFLFYTESAIFKKPILFYNPYCDQEYWNKSKSSHNKEIYTYHPTLSIIKKNQFFDINNKKIDENDRLIFYGSSFIDHKFFIQLFKEDRNFAVRSYGLDQIYLSYLITKNKFIGRTLVFGFLPEDLDRILFNKRNYNKVKYIKENDNFVPTNIPVDPLKETEMSNDFFSYRFLKSITYLILNNFDYKKSKCKSDFKKEFFLHFLQNVINEAKINNQNLIFVTFGFQDEINNKPSWRYEFIKQALQKNNVIHIDTKKIIENDIKKNQSKVEKYYSKIDLHYSEKANKLVAKEIKKLQSYISKR